MITCSNCGFENEASTKICTRCGQLLIDPSSTEILDDSNRNRESSPKYGAVRFGSQLILDVVDGKSRFVFDRDEIQEIIIGRKDPETGTIPAVDLSGENALQQGVSRHHAMILRREEALHIRDNNSSNGTFLNGQRLVADQLRVLRDGDDIQIGNLILRVTFA